MEFDIISDTHFDSHFNLIKPNADMIKGFWYPLKPKAKNLIIAGDIGHYNNQNVNILKELLNNFYDNIFFVLGNHDYYIPNNNPMYVYSDSFDRIKELKELIKDIPNLHLLDGNIINFNGIKIGGAMGWYDGTYHIKNNLSKNDINIQTIWQDCIPDYSYIKPVMMYDEFCQLEYAQISNIIYQEPDIIITHVSPSIKVEHQNPEFKKDISTGFFCYDGEEHLHNFKNIKNGSMKYWIFGHNHYNCEFNIDTNFKLLSNSLGYINSYKYSKIKTIRI